MKRKKYVPKENEYMILIDGKPFGYSVFLPEDKFWVDFMKKLYLDRFELITVWEWRRRLYCSV